MFSFLYFKNLCSLTQSNVNTHCTHYCPIKVQITSMPSKRLAIISI